MGGLCLFLFTTFFVVIMGVPQKKALREVKKADPTPWLVTRDAENLVIHVASREFRLAPSAPVFTRNPDLLSWTKQSWQWKKKHRLGVFHFILLTADNDARSEEWLSSDDFAVRLKKGSLTFDGIQKLLAIPGCSGLPAGAPEPQYNPKTSIYFSSASTLIIRGYKRPANSERRREDIRHIMAYAPRLGNQGEIGIRCDAERWAYYWWIAEPVSNRRKGYCGSFVLDGYESSFGSSDFNKLDRSAPPALPHLTCQQLDYLANNEQFRFHADSDGNVYVPKERNAYVPHVYVPKAAQEAYDNYEDEYDWLYDDADEFESGYNKYIDALYDLYQWIQGN